MSMQNVIGFYDLGNENDYLCNWYASPFGLDGIHFCCMEQYMMYQKAVMFHDEDAKAAILATNDPDKIKKMGRKVKNFDGRMWDGRCQLVVYTGLMAKFTQNEKLRQQLLSTGDAILAECAPNDLRWGIGISLTDERRFDPDLWHGKNLLGYALMEVRERMNSWSEDLRVHQKIHEPSGVPYPPLSENVWSRFDDDGWGIRDVVPPKKKEEEGERR